MRASIMSAFRLLRGARSNAITLAVLGVMLAGCAGLANSPLPTAAMTTKFDPGIVAIGAVSAATAPGVTMTPEDLNRVAQAVKSNLASTYPSRLVASMGPRRSGAVDVRLVFTRYDKGDAVARAILAGLGQIHIEANVSLIDRGTGKTMGEYTAEKTFAWGGIYGAATRVEDVEAGFARSVGEIFSKS